MRLPALLLAAASASAAPLASPFFDLPPGAAPATCVLADGATRTFPRLELRQEALPPGANVSLPLSEQIVVVRSGVLDVTLGPTGARVADSGKAPHVGLPPQPAHARAMIFIAAGDTCQLRNSSQEPAILDVVRFHPATPGTGGGSTPSQVIEWSAAKPRPFAEGERRSFLNAATSSLAHLRMHATTLNPHAGGNPVHHHPWEELTIVEDGAMQALVGSERHKLASGSACVQLAGGDQTYANPYDAPTTFLIIEAIPPGVPAKD